MTPKCWCAFLPSIVLKFFLHLRLPGRRTHGGHTIVAPIVRSLAGSHPKLEFGIDPPARAPLEPSSPLPLAHARAIPGGRRVRAQQPRRSPTPHARRARQPRRVAACRCARSALLPAPARPRRAAFLASRCRDTASRSGARARSAGGTRGRARAHQAHQVAVPARPDRPRGVVPGEGALPGRQLRLARRRGFPGLPTATISLRPPYAPPTIVHCLPMSSYYLPSTSPRLLSAYTRRTVSACATARR
eukprot:scaffold86110_cov56-Phaeocystis_antarctica.AAC.2